MTDALRLSNAIFRAIWENSPRTLKYDDAVKAVHAALAALPTPAPKEIFCGDPYVHDPHDQCLGVRQHEHSLVRPASDRDWTLPSPRMPGVCIVCGSGPNAWCEATCTSEKPYWPPLVKR